MKTIYSNTKRKVLTMALLASLALPMVSCSSDDDNVVQPPVNQNPIQDPLQSYLYTAGFTNTIVVKNGGNYEFGIVFSPIVNGKIKALTAIIPDVHLGMKITIWDYVSKTALRTETIDVTTAGVEAIKTIEDFQLEKDKQYMLTFNSDDWYRHAKQSNGATTYPLTVGDIKITNYGYISATATETLFPTDMYDTYYAGDISFKFQKD